MEKVKNVIIWGNHSSTQYPDVNHGTVVLPDGESSIRAALKDDNWLNGDFIKVRKKKHFFYWHLFVRCYCTDLCISHVTYCIIVLYLSFNIKYTEPAGHLVHYSLLIWSHTGTTRSTHSILKQFFSIEPSNKANTVCVKLARPCNSSKPVQVYSFSTKWKG